LQFLHLTILNITILTTLCFFSHQNDAFKPQETTYRIVTYDYHCLEMICLNSKNKWKVSFKPFGRGAT